MWIAFQKQREENHFWEVNIESEGKWRQIHREMYESIK